MRATIIIRHFLNNFPTRRKSAPRRICRAEHWLSNDMKYVMIG